MAQYTIELDELLQDPNFKLFDFDYSFYLESHKPIFEQKFIDHYRFNEIGFESVKRFKHYLRERLNLIDRYYSQLWATEVRTQDGSIDFMLNKDYTETFERDVDTQQIGSANSQSTAMSDNTSKESNLDNGNATLSLDDSLTSVSKNNSLGTSKSNSNTEDNGTQHEKTTLIGKGDIGVTSSADLLEDWRSILINIDEMIINDCYDLFMQIY